MRPTEKANKKYHIEATFARGGELVAVSTTILAKNEDAALATAREWIADQDGELSYLTVRLRRPLK